MALAVAVASLIARDVLAQPPCAKSGCELFCPRWSAAVFPDGFYPSADTPAFQFGACVPVLNRFVGNLLGQHRSPTVGVGSNATSANRLDLRRRDESRFELLGGLFTIGLCVRQSTPAVRVNSFGCGLPQTLDDFRQPSAVDNNDGLFARYGAGSLLLDDRATTEQRCMSLRCCRYTEPLEESFVQSPTEGSLAYPEQAWLTPKPGHSSLFDWAPLFGYESYVPPIQLGVNNYLTSPDGYCPIHTHLNFNHLPVQMLMLRMDFSY